MNKSLYFLFIIIFVSFLISKYVFNFSFYDKILFTQNNVKLFYQQQIEFLENNLNQHFGQVELIKSLTKENTKLKLENALLDNTKKEYKSLLKLNKLKKENLSLITARMISFVNMSSTSKIWIDFPNFNPSKIYGLIYGDYVAGIVSNENNQAIALLNKDKSCSYSVSIGKKNILGIMVGGASKLSQNIVIDFIQPWKNINIGDEVKTSGLDGVFVSNIKVGKVIKIEKIRGYKKAIVKPYIESGIGLKYFYILDIVNGK